VKQLTHWIVTVVGGERETLVADRYYTEKDGELVLINEESADQSSNFCGVSVLVKRYSKYGWLSIQPHVPLEQRLADAKAKREEAEAVEKSRQAFLLRPITECELSVRSEHCLRNDGIDTIADLLLRSEADLKRIPNFGTRSLQEIKDLIRYWGVTLSPTDRDFK